jgi:hypothetical protein
MISFGDGTARQPNNPQQNKQFQRLSKHTSTLRFIQIAQKRKTANAHLHFYGKTQINQRILALTLQFLWHHTPNLKKTLLL